MQHPLDMRLARLRQKRRLGFRARLLMAIKILLIVAGDAIFWTLSG